MPDAVPILTYMPVCKILNTEIIDELKDQGNVEKIVVETIRFRTNNQLHLTVYSQKIECLYEKIGNE